MLFYRGSLEDIGRSEVVVADWFKTAKLGEISSFIIPDYNGMGMLGQRISSFRAKLLRGFQACRAAGEFTEFTHEDFADRLPKLPRDLELVHKLVLPLGTNYQVLAEDKTFAETRLA